MRREVDTMPDRARYAGAVHWRAEPDATLCDEYLDPTARDADPSLEPDAWADAMGPVTCATCATIRRTNTLDRAAALVAAELGVDACEVTAYGLPTA